MNQKEQQQIDILCEHERNYLSGNASRKINYVAEKMIEAYEMACEETKESPSINPLNVAMVERINCWDSFTYYIEAD